MENQKNGRIRWVVFLISVAVLLVFLFFLLFIGPAIMLIYGISVTSTLDDRQDQINEFNKYVLLWESSAQDVNNTLRERVQRYKIKYAATSDRKTSVESLEFESVNMKYSNEKYFKGASLTKPGDNPALSDYSSNFVVGKPVFIDMDYTGAAIGHFKLVDSEDLVIGEFSQLMFKENTYDCSCIRKCYELCCGSYPEGCYSCKCHTICDLCTKYYKLHYICIVVNPNTNEVSNCFGDFAHYRETNMMLQDVTVSFEIRHPADPEVKLYEITGESKQFEETSEEKVARSSLLVIVGAVVIVFELGLLFLAFVALFYTYRKRDVVERKCLELVEGMKKYDRLGEVFADIMQEDNLISFASKKKHKEVVVDLSVAIDISASNLVKGKDTFAKKSLHHTHSDMPNPYQRVLTLLRPLCEFENVSTSLGFFYGFREGCKTVAFLDHQSFMGEYEEMIARTLQEQADKNFHSANHPSSLCHVCRAFYGEVIEASDEEESPRTRVLVIITDGQVKLDGDTLKLMEKIQNLASPVVSIIALVIGDGPWSDIHSLEYELNGYGIKCFRYLVVSELYERSGVDEFEFLPIAIVKEILFNARRKIRK